MCRGQDGCPLKPEGSAEDRPGITTAKITCQHGIFCHDFIDKKGRDAAEQYVRANQAAVENIRGSYKKRGLTVIWRRKIPMYILRMKRN